MRRGEIWTVADALDYAGKPRPSLILQDDVFDIEDSVTVCGFTSSLTDANLIRIRVEPSSQNGLFQISDIMADKITTVPREKLGRQIGTLEAKAMDKVSAALLLFLGLSRAQAV